MEGRARLAGVAELAVGVLSSSAGWETEKAVEAGFVSPGRINCARGFVLLSLDDEAVSSAFGFVLLLTVSAAAALALGAGSGQGP
jgi:hypothetical protein